MRSLQWGVGSGATDAGPRPRNEDSYCASGPVFIVADGMGGHAAGAAASAAVVEAFLPLVGVPVISPDEVAAAVEQAQVDVMAVSAQVGSHSGSTLTGVLTVEHNGEPWWMVINVGDSRVYRVTETFIQQVTVDHSYVQDLLDAGEITAVEALTHPERNVVTRAIGDGMLGFDAWLMPAIPGEWLVVCSDGLTRAVTDSRIAEVVRLSGADVAERLVDAALAGKTSDNVTAVVVQAVGVHTSAGAESTPWRLWSEDPAEDDTTQTTRVRVWA
jgi:serine/threonine protein phosphatase PrpC